MWIRTICLIVTLIIGLLAAPMSVDAQQVGKMYRIGYLRSTAGPGEREEAFRQGLRDLGWTEAQNITIEYLWAAGRRDRLPALAEELVRLKVDLMVTAGAQVMARAAKHVTSPIPIVMAVAAERDRPIRIFQLTSAWGPGPIAAGLRDGLLMLGYREREDFVLGVRFTRGDLTVLPDAARELVGQYKADILFTSQDADATLAAKKATTQTPIVFVGGGDPVKMGMVQSYARPGGNITGVTHLDLELVPKRRESG